MRTLVDPNNQLLAAVLRRSLAMAKTDARLLRHKNAKALRLGIEQLERKTAEKLPAEAKTARLAKEQACAVHRMAGIVSSDSDSNNSDDASPAADTYTEGKGEEMVIFDALVRLRFSF